VVTDGLDKNQLRQVLVRAAHDSRVDWRFLHEEAGELPMTEEILGRHVEEHVRRREQLFVDLLFTLTHYEFPPARAEALWREILEHRDRLAAAVGRNVGVCVAALDYLKNVTREVEHPVVAPEALLLGAVEAATRDDLTGLFDRATARTVLESELIRTERYGQPVSIALADVDHFKRINDSMGHSAGDRVLSGVAAVMEGHSRAIDIVARYGGEEFLVVAPGIGDDEAWHMAERLRVRVRRELRDPQVTVSVGVVTARARCAVEELIERADVAMYAAKRAGRDRTHSAGVVPDGSAKETTP
jgi:diguanylate cyclase (GGDEF)-like protein